MCVPGVEGSEKKCGPPPPRIISGTALSLVERNKNGVESNRGLQFTYDNRVESCGIVC